MKRMEVKNIDLMSVFKLFGSMSFILGFILALFGSGFGGAAFRQQLQTVPFVGPLLQGVLGAVIFGLIAAIFNGLCAALSAVIYNIFAMIMGGVELEINERA
ncbi:MAG: DUF3566 domain-containing protein [Candidatus Omnitrophota bacterium]